MDSQPRDQPVHRGLRLYVRPPRIAVAVEPGDNWHQRARACLIAVGEVWGGISSVLFAGDEMQPWKRRLLRTHDPDYVATFWPTVRSWFPTYAEADSAEEWVAKQAASLVSSHGLTPDQAAEIAKDYLDQHVSDWNLPDRIKNELAVQLPLLSEPGRPYVTLEAAPWEYVSMADVDQSTLPQLHVVDPPFDDDSLKVLTAFRIGDVTHRYAALMRSIDAQPVRHTVPAEDVEDFLAYLWTGSVDQGSLQIRKAVAEAEGRAYAEPLWTQRQALENTPTARSGYGLAELVPRVWRYEDDAAMVVVVGDSLEDFCLAMAYERLYGNGRAIWMPQVWMNGRTLLSRRARTALRTVISRFLVRSGDLKVFVTSVSLDRRSVGAYLGVLRRDQLLYGNRLMARDLAEIDFSSDTRRWSDIEIWDRYTGSTWEGRHQLDRINTPMPTQVRTNEVSQMTWQVDAVIDQYHCPPRPGLSSALTSPDTALGVYGIRPSSSGISYMGISPFIEAGAPLNRSVVSPKLRMPTANEVLGKLASDQGLTLQLSSAGAFTEATLHLWGGLESLASDLATPSRRALLNAFHTRKGQTSTDEQKNAGIWLDHAKRRYVSFADAMEITGLQVDELREWLDHLIRLGVLNRGLILHCEICRLNAWYPIEELGSEFTCSRCRSTLLVSQKAWKRPLEEPNFYYELNEVVYQGTPGDVATIVLSLHSLKKETRHAFDFSPQLDVVSEKGLLGDLDIAALADGRILVGEAKSNDRLGDDEKKEREVLNRLHSAGVALRADGIVLATASRRWRKKTRDLINEKLDSTRYEVILKEGVGS